MADEPSQGLPKPDPAGDASAKDAPTADKLDELLAEAAALADEVSDEIGPPENAAPAAKTNQPATTTPGNTGDVDSQLAELEGVLTQTQNELGIEPAPSDPPSPPQPERQPSDGPSPASDPPVEKSNLPESNEIPDFMAEFTEPERPEEPEGGGESSSSDASAEGVTPAEPAPGPVEPVEKEIQSVASPSEAEEELPASPTESAEAAKAGDGVSDTSLSTEPPKPDEKVGVVGSTIATADFSEFADSLPTESSLPEEAGTPPEATEDPPACEKSEGFCVKAVRRVPALISPVLLPACSVGIGLLEKFDTPTRWLGSGARTVIGWIALATTGTALIVFLLSLW